MIDIVGKKNWYFLISLVLIIPGIISLLLHGLNLSIDFTGGSRTALRFQDAVNERTVASVRDAFEKENVEIATVQRSENAVFVRSTPVSEQQNARIQRELRKNGNVQQEEFVTIGPTVGREAALNALKAIAISSFLIVLYIAYSFRKVPKPTSSWRFGVCAVAALLHDVLLLVGVFSLLGYFLQVEIDSLFITALLTVIGFSVHDTIVVFDRIRENLIRTTGIAFPKIVNDSILQTMNRSLNTSFTALLVLLGLLLFGGESIRWFTLALFIGIASGTYSSIFNAAPLLVLWDEWESKRKKVK